jgi:PiT family inorganic phosphate transporter
LDLASIVFLASGLFLGWSLGANDAANVFGTAVGTGMLRFRTAALVCSIFVMLGAALSDGGTTATLSRLGAVDTLPAAFGVAFAAAFAVYGMSRMEVSVSTTQAIVGAIVGWNLFADRPTDLRTLSVLAATWVVCPLLTAAIAMLLYQVTLALTRVAKLHLLRQDAYTRVALVLTGAFGAYALGANNIANIMGVFAAANPFAPVEIDSGIYVGARQQLFLLGGMAIALGVVTYSQKVMLTIGSRLLPMTPIGGWVAVMAHSLVLFAFASAGLQHWLRQAGLPALPLVPVSSSQAIVGAVIGIGLVKGGRGLNWQVVGRIGLGWLVTPTAACVLSFVTLFCLQKVFDQTVVTSP